MPSAPETAARGGIAGRATPRRTGLHRRIFAWYARNARPFPWRETRDPYRILLSEVMLQQTQASRVALLFPRFLSRFPDLASLARAPKGDVLRAWRGMGYNNRAVRLHDAVREVAAEYRGRIPENPETLRALPGVGRYTANAVACFAHGRPVPVVDVNVRRVLSRIFRPADKPELTEREAWELAAEVLPARAYDWNQALMELGGTVCTARNPRCGICPVRSECRSAGRIPAMTRGTTGRAAGRSNGSIRREPTTPGSTRPEPSHRGIPRRVWRGLVVDALRDAPGAVDAARLRRMVGARAANGAAARTRTAAKDHAPSLRWMTDLLARLERDGVVSLTRRPGGRVAARLAR